MSSEGPVTCVGEPTPDVHHRVAVLEDRDRAARVAVVQEPASAFGTAANQIVVGALDDSHGSYQGASARSGQPHFAARHGPV